MIRFATPADADAVADIHVDAWRAAYADIVPAGYLAALSKTQRAEAWRRAITADPAGVLVEEENGVTRGWISFGPCRDDGKAAAAEVYALYVRPDSWRRGIGHELMQKAEQELRDRGYTCAFLWVLAQNRPARSFYERLGYAPDGHHKTISLAGASLDELRYQKIHAPATPPLPGPPAGQP